MERKKIKTMTKNLMPEKFKSEKREEKLIQSSNRIECMHDIVLDIFVISLSVWIRIKPFKYSSCFNFMLLGFLVAGERFFVFFLFSNKKPLKSYFNLIYLSYFNFWKTLQRSFKVFFINH